jgi:hypothetical protein
MNGIANSKLSLLNPDKNPLLRRIVRVVFYNHFAAGENDAEVKKTITTIKGMGFKGVILCYAKELIVDPAATREEAARSGTGAITNDSIITIWKEGVLQTLNKLESGDFLAIKLVTSLTILRRGGG